MDTNFQAGMPLHPVEATRQADGPKAATLGLWDAVSIIVGIIIGVGIFWTPPSIFAQVAHPTIAIGLWILGGVFALVGALCFAELAAAYPRSGGEYVYLTRAFGPLTGFLFAWSQLSVTRSGSVAGMAYIFGASANALFGFDNDATFILAGLSVVGLTVINVLGVRMGTRTQNVLTVAKLVGLGVLIVVGFIWRRPDAPLPMIPPVPTEVWLAGPMIFILWTYSGWHEAAYIVSEAKHRTRNIPLALIIGTSIVTLIYVLINIAYWLALGDEGVTHKDIAANLLNLVWPGYGARAMDVLIMVSSLGAINGMIFTTARIYSAFGQDHRIFKTMSHWSKRFKTPVRALLIQGGICVAMIVGVWWAGGKDDAFDRTVKLTVAVFWSFFFLTGVALIRLRQLDPDTPRPFRVPGYPLLPIVFCSWCAYIVVGTIIDDCQKGAVESLVGVVVLLAGLPLYFIPQKLKARKSQHDLVPLSK